MNRLDNKYINIFAIFVLIFLLRMPRVSESLYFYGTHALNMMNPNYLANTPEVLGINHAISPRIFFDYLLYIPMRLGLSFEITAFIWNCIADLLFASGIVYLIRAVVIKRYFILSVLLMLCIISTPIISSSFGFPYYYEQEPPLTLAISVEMIAISFAIRRKWNIAFTIAGIGALFHIHEGMYGGGVIFILFLLRCWYDKNNHWSKAYMILFWVCSILALTIPTLLTDRAEIDNAEFCNFYRQYVGHMSFFSAVPSNVFYLLSSVGLYYICYKCLREKCFLSPQDVLVLFIVAVLGMLFVVIFVDVFPFSFVYKLYVQKFFKYISIIIIVQYIAYLNNICDSNNDTLLFQRILLTLSNVFTPVMVVITALAEFFFGDKNKNILRLILLMTLITSAYIVTKDEDFICKLIVLITIIPLIIHRKLPTKIGNVISLVSILLLFCICSNNYFSNWNNVFYSNDFDNKGNNDFYFRVRKIIPQGSTYLPSPNIGDRIFTINYATGLSSYIWPGPPSSTIGTKINLERYSSIKNWDKYSINEKLAKAKVLNIDYILVKSEENTLGIEPLEQNENYKLIQVY